MQLAHSTTGLTGPARTAVQPHYIPTPHALTPLTVSWPPEQSSSNWCYRFEVPNHSWGINTAVTNAAMSGAVSFDLTCAILQQAMTRGLPLFYRNTQSRPSLFLNLEEHPSSITACSPIMHDNAVRPDRIGCTGKRSRSQIIDEFHSLLIRPGSDGSPTSTPLPAQSIRIAPRKRHRTASPTLSTSIQSPRRIKHGLGGEKRLTIQFIHAGILKSPIQTFGRYKLVIPDGLSGTHGMYGQSWRFEIKQVEGFGPGENDEVQLRWTITNALSGRTISYSETTEQAKERQVNGNTICNLIVREALTRRAEELETEIRGLNPGSTRAGNLRSLVKELRPKQCTEGLLFFGLRHQVAQRNRQGESPRHRRDCKTSDGELEW